MKANSYNAGGIKLSSIAYFLDSLGKFLKLSLSLG